MAQLKPHARALAFLAALAILAYLPCLWFPFIADDYGQIAMARNYGVPSGWFEMWSNTAFRFRITYIELSWVLDRIFGFTPGPFYAVSIGLHVACTWLVYATGIWKRTPWQVTLPAAAFFAVCEGHQEAVMWLAASMELLLFLFGVGAFLCWIRWLDTAREAWYAASILCFAIALISKESAVVIPALMALAGFHWRRLIPFGIMSLAAVGLALGGSNARLSDGSFSLHAPFWITLPNSLWRLLFVWGFLALPVVWKQRDLIRTAVLWMVIALLPYSFLLYMHRVPSRQTYLASLGLSWLVGAAWTNIDRRGARLAVAIVVIATNLGFLWIRKRRQYLERAAPTEQLKAAAQNATEPVRIHCFPYGYWTARFAVESIGKQAVDDPWPGSTPGCLAFSVDGRLIRLSR